MSDAGKTSRNRTNISFFKIILLYKTALPAVNMSVGDNEELDSSVLYHVGFSIAGRYRFA